LYQKKRKQETGTAKPVPEDTVRSVGYQLLRALVYLHSGGAMHRDVATKNVLWTAVPNEEGILSGREAVSPPRKNPRTSSESNPTPSPEPAEVPLRLRVALADFGLARSVEEEAGAGLPGVQLSDRVVTLHYRAPEVITGQGLGDSHYGYGVDIWALGLCVAEMVNVRQNLLPLLPGKSIRQQLDYIILLVGVPELDDVRDSCCGDAMRVLDSYKKKEKQGGKKVGTEFSAYFEKASPDCIEAMRRMLVFEPTRRPSGEDLLPLEFFGHGARLCGELPGGPPRAKRLDDGVPAELLTPRAGGESACDREKRRDRVRDLIRAETGCTG